MVNLDGGRSVNVLCNRMNIKKLEEELFVDLNFLKEVTSKWESYLMVKIHPLDPTSEKHSKSL